MKKLVLSGLVLATMMNMVYAIDQKLKPFDLSAVKLLESPFYQAQQADLAYILALEPDRLLAPFLVEAGLETKADLYPNWENSGLNGHIGGHYLSALALMYASTGNPELKERLDYMINELARCQEANGNGYVGGVPRSKELWAEIANGKIDAGNFSLNHRWVPLYNIHKLYAGLRDAYVIAGNEKAKEMLIKLSDWCVDLTKDLSDQQIQQILVSEHGGMNEVFVDVYDITGDEKYLELANQFSHRLLLDPLLKGENKLTGMHANTQIPKVIGYKRYADAADNQEWNQAADFFWNIVVDEWTVSIGGNSVREHFHPTNDFSSMVSSNQGPETCNTYNMMRLSKMFFLTDPQAKYIDYYERAMYNHILSSEHPTHGGFVYFTPMRPRHYRVYSQPQQGFWCCVGSGLENHGKYGELIYAHNEENLFVNLFVPSVLEWKEKGITVTQQTEFPYSEITELTINVDKSKKFAINVRIPSWVDQSEFKVFINGKEFPLMVMSGAFAPVYRKWKDGDVMTVKLPMQTKVEYLPDGSPWASIVRGPVVLAAVTDSSDLDGLWADDSRMGHVANGQLYPVEKAPVIVTDKKDFSSDVIPVKERPLAFTLNGLIYPEEKSALQLVPFFEVHEARYMIYWPVTTSEELEEKLEAIKKEEAEMLALEAKTVDQVAPGEQQPESDHNFKGEKTKTGRHQNRFWRDATGWFSYDLRDPDKEGQILRITYFGSDKGRNFDILVNDAKIATVNLQGENGNKFFTVDYTIPDNVRNDSGKLTLKFVAHENSVAGGIYYVRLLRTE